MNRIIRNRYLILRRITQISILFLFIVGYHWDWKIFNVEILQGNLSASYLFEAIPLADPFAALQIWISGQSLTTEILIGALIITLFYFLLGGKVFCSWVCPVNIVTDSAHRLRNAVGIPSAFQLDRRLKYGVLILALILSSLSGVAAFEWVSPISMLHRELVFGMHMGWIATAAIFIFDLLLVKNGWCKHICPLGAMYSLIGKWSPIRIKFHQDRCTKCGECHRVCPEAHVLNLRKIGDEGMVLSGDCSNCGRCITHCPEECFQFSFRGSRRKVNK